MLALSRKANQKILIGENIVITIVEIRGNQVRIGISAPKHISIVRDDAVRKSPRTTVAAEQSPGGCKGERHHG
jgi:carbon storage regulator